MRLYQREDPLWSLTRIAITSGRHCVPSESDLTSATLGRLCEGYPRVDHLIFSRVRPESGEVDAVISSSRSSRAACSAVAPRADHFLEFLSPLGWLLEPGERAVLLHTESEADPDAGKRYSTSFGMSVASGTGPVTVQRIWKLHGVDENRPWVLKAIAGDLVQSGRLPKVDRLVVPKENVREPAAVVSPFDALASAWIECCRSAPRPGEKIRMVEAVGDGTILLLDCVVWQAPAIDHVHL